jgi:hypothetical protein
MPSIELEILPGRLTHEMNRDTDRDNRNLEKNVDDLRDPNEKERPNPAKNRGDRKSDLGLEDGNPAQHGTGRDDPSDTR